MALRLVSSLFVFFASLYLAFSHDVSPDTSLVTLTDENFNNHVNTTISTWLVMFYAPWCPHCKHAMPEYDQFAKNFAGQINVGLVDCDANPTLRSRFSVPGYPTFLLLKEGQMYPYKGYRNVDGWTKFVTEEYKTVEGEEIPLEASVIKNLGKEFKRFFEQLQAVAKQKPLVFGGILGGFLLIMGLTCFCASSVEEKYSGKTEEEKQGGGAHETSTTKSSTQKKDD